MPGTELSELLRGAMLLGVAALLGGLVGFERESVGKEAGLRTHMLVSLGTAFVVVSSVQSGLTPEGISRVVQGLVTGIGFLGAGAILKKETEGDIRGLTTAASLWMTSAIGIAVGLGRVWLAATGCVITLVILFVIAKVEKLAKRKGK
jgi:putative Mg2+ transporter-C (MgtC) family protein